jgi:hypothetical protein
MRLWHLLIGLCFAVPVGSALAPARIAEAGIGGYVLAAVTGVLLGALCSWIMWRMHKALVPNLLLHLERGEPLAQWYGRAFYVSKVLWIILAGVLGFWLSAVLLRAML